MSGQLESALVLRLVDAIKWESSLGPKDSTGALTQVDLDTPLDVTQYARRDRELAFRDMINAAAVVKVSLEAETVWNSPALRPRVEGLTTDIMPSVPVDLGSVNSFVAHVKQTSIPKDALETDKDLAGRDALVYEVLARACQIFSEPPLAPNDYTGTVIPSQSAWSLAEGTTNAIDISTGLPLNRNLFKNPDRRLAGRDNEVAAYASNLIKILQNPFAYASRIYVKITGVDEREVETYTVIREYWDASVTYVVDDEVFYDGAWYVSVGVSTGEVPSASTLWSSIDFPSERIFVAEPAFSGRNRIVYNVAQKTLQWTSETATQIHPPQIFALSIPGAIPGQVITTVPEIPQAQDAQFWRQKASRISYEGTIASHLEGYHDSTVLRTGQAQTDTVGLTAPGDVVVPFSTTLTPTSRYKFSALVKPSQTVDIYGAYNQQALSGTLSGATFLSAYTPTLTSPGAPVSFSLSLPAGNWTASLEYTNLGLPTEGFGIKMSLNGVEILQDASPLLFQDNQGNQFPPGRLVESGPVSFVSSGGASTLNITWTYGEGLFHLRALKLETRDRNIARYSMRLDVTNALGNTFISQDGTLVPSVDSFGERRQYATMPFEFSVLSPLANPRMVLKWLPEGDGLPLQTRQFELEQMVHTSAVPEIGGFLGWKQECMDRAHRCVNTSFNTFISFYADENMPDFTLDGTLWDRTSTEKWMSAIETYQPRLREAAGVSSIVSGHQYQVFYGDVVYNGGTYSAGQRFYGTNVSDFSSSGTETRLDQVGAFAMSFPGQVGNPCLVPAGLWFDGIQIKQANFTKYQIPQISALQPWMIEAGIYVAQRDFWVTSSNQPNAVVEVPAPFEPIAVMRVTPNPLHIGEVLMGNTGTGVWTVENVGNIYFSGTAVLSAGSFSVLSGGSYALNIGETAPVSVVYVPFPVGSTSGTVAWSDSAFATFSGAQGVTSVVDATSHLALYPTPVLGSITWPTSPTGNYFRVAYHPATRRLFAPGNGGFYSRISTATDSYVDYVEYDSIVRGSSSWLYNTELVIDTKYDQIFVVDQVGKYLFIDPYTNAFITLAPVVSGVNLGTPNGVNVAYDYVNGIVSWHTGNTVNSDMATVDCATRMTTVYTGLAWNPGPARVYNPDTQKVVIASFGQTFPYYFWSPSSGLSQSSLSLTSAAVIYYVPELHVLVAQISSKIYVIDAITDTVLENTFVLGSSDISGAAYNPVNGLLYVTVEGFTGRLVKYDPNNSWSSTATVEANMENPRFDPYSGCFYARITNSTTVVKFV